RGTDARGARGGGGGGRVTVVEGRAQFAVLERFAYLNAGSSRPLPGAAVEAAEARLQRGLSQGGSGMPYINEVIELRERIRERIAALLETTAEFVALADSTTRGCQI